MLLVIGYIDQLSNTRQTNLIIFGLFLVFIQYLVQDIFLTMIADILQKLINRDKRIHFCLLHQIFNQLLNAKVQRNWKRIIFLRGFIFGYFDCW